MNALLLSWVYGPPDYADNVCFALLSIGGFWAGSMLFRRMGRKERVAFFGYVAVMAVAAYVVACRVIHVLSQPEIGI